MVWPPIYSVSLTFAGCPLQLYLLRMFCSSAHRKISFRTWFFQMFFNKSLIKCEKFVSCLMQYSKKYWKWPETYVLILHSYWTPQLQNFAVPPIWLSSYSITQKCCYLCMAFSLHNFKLFKFHAPPSQKKQNRIFQWTPIMLKFWSLILSHPSFKCS